MNLPINHSDTIERSPHDEENPYTMILNSLIRDDSISPNCRLLIIHLLSNKNQWKIQVLQIIKQFKNHLGRDTIYALVNEAIEAGYIKREEYFVKNLKKYRYLLSEKPKFKKFFRYPESQYTENQDAIERIYSDNKYTGSNRDCGNVHNSPPPPAPPDDLISSIPSFQEENSIFSQEEVELVQLEPKYAQFFRPHIFSRWLKKFGTKLVLDTVKFFLHVKETQKKRIPNPEAWMESAFTNSYAEKNKQCQENKEFAEKLKKDYNLKSLKIKQRYCQDTRAGKDYYFNLPNFKNTLKENYFTEIYSTDKRAEI